jgi:hypothetical protein
LFCGVVRSNFCYLPNHQSGNERQKVSMMDRRNFLKSTFAATVLATSPAASSRMQEATVGSVSKVKKKNSPIAAREGTIIRSDMSQCLPAENLSRTFQRDHWQLIDYETTEGVKGFMASARPDENCGELTLNLNAVGLYKIYLGIFLTKSHYPGGSNYGELEVKLTNDVGFRRVGPEYKTVDEDGTTKFGDDEPNINKVITEAYWKTADLTGQSLTLRQMPYPYNRPEHAGIANLSYVRLEPLTEWEKRQWQQLQPSDETRKLGLIFCTGQYTGHISGTYTFHPTSKQWFKDEFEPFANSDIKILIFEALRGNSCVYKTRIGSVETEDNAWQEDWLDPLAEFTKLAHSNGMKIFASMRFIGPQYPMNRSPIAWASYYWKNPQWTKLTKEEVPITNLSLAYPEVRQYWLSLLRETLDYGTDGIQLHLNRSEPYVFYEEPVVSAFEGKYGEDPRRLSVEDPRWMAHCAEYVTQFVREVRALVDEKPGRQLGITVSGRKNGQPAYYEENHCDVETWLKGHLVNYIMPTPYLHVSLLKKWRKIGGDTIHIWPDLMPRAQSAASYARTAKAYYQAGADGLCLWDGERRTARISEWAGVQRLGHTNQLDQIIEQGPSYYRAVDLKYLGGFDVKWSFRDG